MNRQQVWVLVWHLPGPPPAGDCPCYLGACCKGHATHTARAPRGKPRLVSGPFADKIVSSSCRLCWSLRQVAVNKGDLLGAGFVCLQPFLRPVPEVHPTSTGHQEGWRGRERSELCSLFSMVNISCTIGPIRIDDRICIVNELQWWHLHLTPQEP